MGAGQRLSAGYDWERETNRARRAFELDNHGFFVQQEVGAWRSLVRDGRRTRRQQGELQHVRQPEAVGGRLRWCRSGRAAVVAEGVRQHRPRHQVADVHASASAARFADPAPDLQVNWRGPAISASKRPSPISGFAASCDVLQQRLHRSDRVPFRHRRRRHSRVHQHRRLEGHRLGARAGRCSGRSRGLTRHRDVRLRRHQGGDQHQHQPAVSTGQPLLRRPKHSGTLRAAYSSRPRHACNFNVRIVGQRFDNSFLSLRTVPNAAASHRDHHRHHGQSRLRGHGPWRRPSRA